MMMHQHKNWMRKSYYIEPPPRHLLYARKLSRLRVMYWINWQFQLQRDMETLIQIKFNSWSSSITALRGIKWLFSRIFNCFILLRIFWMFYQIVAITKSPNCWPHYGPIGPPTTHFSFYYLDAFGLGNDWEKTQFLNCLNELINKNKNNRVVVRLFFIFPIAIRIQAVGRWRVREGEKRRSGAKLFILYSE